MNDGVGCGGGRKAVQWHSWCWRLTMVEGPVEVGLVAERGGKDGGCGAVSGSRVKGFHGGGSRWSEAEVMVQTTFLFLSFFFFLINIWIMVLLGCFWVLALYFFFF